MRDIVVVGASVAGLTAAETLRREGFRGSITVVGDEPGEPYDRPPLSKQILASTWDADRIALRSTAGLGLNLRLGVRATGLGSTVRLENGAEIPYDGLIIATGVRPRRLPGGPAHVLRTLPDALRLRARLTKGRRLAVVGAGFLGAECASVARGIGCDVVLIEPAPVPLAHAVGEDIGRMLAQVHEEHGTELRTGVAVRAVTPEGVCLENGELVRADETLVAVGSAPNTEWLIESGLSIDDGVICDEFSAAAPHIYAAGDVARWPNPRFGVPMRVEHRTNAAEQGLAAARNLLNPDARKPFAPVPYFWSDQYDLKIQAHGCLRDHDEVLMVEGSLETRKFIAAYRRGDRLVGVLSVGVPPKHLRPWRQAVGSSWKDLP